jgi:hypothetical protein
MAWTAKPATPPDPEAILELPHSAEATTGVLLSVLVMAHRQTSALQTILGPKGQHPYTLMAANAAIDGLGIGEAVLRSDQEPVILKFM